MAWYDVVCHQSILGLHIPQNGYMFIIINPKENMDHPAVQLDCGSLKKDWFKVNWCDVQPIFWSSKGQFLENDHLPISGKCWDGSCRDVWGLSHDPECGIDLDWPWLTLIAPEASCLHSKFTSWAVSRWDLRWNQAWFDTRNWVWNSIRRFKMV